MSIYIYLEGIDHTHGLNGGHGGEEDDSHRAGSDQRRRSEGQKHAHAPLHGDDHGHTARAEERPHVETHNMDAHG